MSDFVHLHCHTEYSLLLSTIRICDLCERTKAYGMGACAITDHGNLFGVPSFYSTFKDYGLKPIIGCELFVCTDHNDKNRETSRQNHHLVLLAQNNTGYQNLVRLVNHGFLDGFWGIPRVDKSQLRRYAEGLICLSDGLAGDIPDAILGNEMDRACALAREYASIYPGNFYLELQANGLSEQERVNTVLLELGDTMNLPVVATNDCHYLDADDADAFELLLCIRMRSTLKTFRRKGIETRDFHYKSPEEMEQAFSHVPEALSNMTRIAESCRVELAYRGRYFSVNPLHADVSVESKFKVLAEEGLEKRLEAHPDREHIDIDRYRARLQSEIAVINEMGLSGYFLILHEVNKWAKSLAIPVGPGRGPLAASLVAWALKITNIDPVRYELFFERFFSPTHDASPTFTVEVGERGVRRVIRHMYEMFEYGKVARITTFENMEVPELIYGLGFALGMEREVVAQINEDLLYNSDRTPKNIAHVLGDEIKIKELYDKGPQIQRLLGAAKCLVGLVHNASTRPTSLIVSDRPLEEYQPIYRGLRDELFTQFEGDMLEKMGLPPFNIHGLGALTLIQDTLDNISGQGIVPPELDNLPLTDKSVYELYGRGDTEGIFQMEDSRMRHHLQILKPTNFDELMALLALKDADSLDTGMRDEFIARKHGLASVVYPHEALQEILNDTYGILIYHEQFIRIVQRVARYTPEEADRLYRTLCKGEIGLLEHEKLLFIARAVEIGISKEKVNDILDLLVKFRRFGSSKTNVVADSIISYYTAYLKTHYKIEFMSALLTSVMGCQEKMHKYIISCRNMGIEVAPPSINESEREFSVHDGRILFGLGGIKNMSARGAIRDIVEIRHTGGLYSSLFDLASRVNLRRVTKNVLKSLIKSGACDCFGVPRAAMLASLDWVLQRAQEKADAVRDSSGASP